MPSFATNYERNLIAANRFSAQPSGTPVTYYAALLLVAPAVDGTGFTEVAGSGYARVALTNNGTNFSVTTDTATNATLIAWPTATGGNYGTVVGVALFDSTGSTEIRYYFELTTPILFNENDTPQIQVNNLLITYANA